MLKGCRIRFAWPLCKDDTHKSRNKKKGCRRSIWFGDQYNILLELYTSTTFMSLSMVAGCPYSHNQLRNIFCFLATKFRKRNHFRKGISWLNYVECCNIPICSFYSTLWAPSPFLIRYYRMCWRYSMRLMSRYNKHFFYFAFIYVSFTWRLCLECFLYFSDENSFVSADRWMETFLWQKKKKKKTFRRYCCLFSNFDFGFTFSCFENPKRKTLKYPI